MSAKTVQGINNPKAPYSAVRIVGNMYFFSGVIPDLDKDGKLVSPDNPKEQIQQVLAKIEGMLKIAGLTKDDIFQVAIFLKGSMQFFPLVNELYSEFFSGISILPARTALAIAALPFGAEIEIQFNAAKE